MALQDTLPPKPRDGNDDYLSEPLIGRLADRLRLERRQEKKGVIIQRAFGCVAGIGAMDVGEQQRALSRINFSEKEKMA